MTAPNQTSVRRCIREAVANAGITSDEIDAINGWLLRQADALGLDLPSHRRIIVAVKARHP